MTIRIPARPMLCLVGVALIGLTACQRAGEGEMAWARAAIERNSQLEIVAADPSTNVFTVRVKDTGELRTVRADEVLGALPPASGDAKSAAPADSKSAAPAQPATVAPSVASAPQPSAPPAVDPGTLPVSAPVAGPAQPGDAVMPLHDETVTPPAQAAAVPVEAVGRGVLAAGPGYSIKRASGSSMTVAAARTTPAVDRGSPGAGLAVERRYEPIICQGGRLLHIDSRNLEFAGDAVAAEDGCEIHITNSRISAKGLGVLARAASVHIKNSSIEGESGSVEATDGAQVYVQSSTFKGLSRRHDTAALHDLGGNVWN